MDINTESSTSCDWCNCYICQAGLDCRNLPQTPFYPAMGQPLVYYSEIPSKRKKRPNCFVRAFNWYTSDLRSSKQEIQTSNLGAFASWLDEKYEQFILENPSAGGGAKVTQTSVIEVQARTPPCTTETRPSDTCPPCCNSREKNRTHGRTNSQKKRLRGRSEERASSDDRLRGNQSMEYILPPKELNRAASIGCRPTPTSCCSVQQRCVIKSQSLTSVERELCSEDDRAKAPMKFDNPPVEKKSSVVCTRLSKTIKKKEATVVNRSCQCFVDVERRDVHTQYDACQSTATVETLARDLPCTPKTSFKNTPSLPSTPSEKEMETKKGIKGKHSPSRSRSSKDSKYSLNSKKKLNVIGQCPANTKGLDKQVQCDQPARQIYPVMTKDVQVQCECPTEVKKVTKVQSKPPPRSCECSTEVKINAQVQSSKLALNPCVCPMEVKLGAEANQQQSKGNAVVKIDAQTQSKELPHRTCEYPADGKPEVQAQSKGLPLRPCECPENIQVDAQVQSEELPPKSCQCCEDSKVQNEQLSLPPPAPITSHPNCLQCRCLTCHHSAIKYDEYGTRTSCTSYPVHMSHQSVIINTAPQEVIKKCSRDCPRIKRPTCTRGTECVSFQMTCAQTSDHAIDLERGVRTIHGYPFYLKIISADKN